MPYALAHACRPLGARIHRRLRSPRDVSRTYSRRPNAADYCPIRRFGYSQPNSALLHSFAGSRRSMDRDLRARVSLVRYPRMARLPLGRLTPYPRKWPPNTERIVGHPDLEYRDMSLIPSRLTLPIMRVIGRHERILGPAPSGLISCHPERGTRLSGNACLCGRCAADRSLMRPLCIGANQDGRVEDMPSPIAGMFRGREKFKADIDPF